MKMRRKTNVEDNPTKLQASYRKRSPASGAQWSATGKELILTGGGEMGERIRAFDWSQTPLGPIESWSPALLTTVRIMLANRFPLLLWWGPEYISLYNDAYIPILGEKHPWGLGKPVSECWKEIWHILQPLIDTPFKGGPSTWNDDIFLEINRHGFTEETHFTIAYSPIPDETVQSGIGGVLATVHEITEKVIGERRIVTLRDLGARVGEARTAEEACRIAAETLSQHDRDIPFALLYLIDRDGKRCHLAGVAGTTMNEDISPLTVDLSEVQEGIWPLAKAWQTEAMQVVEKLGEHLSSVPPGPWSDPPSTAVVVPIPSNKAHEPAGLLVAGVSARLKFDQLYKDFIEFVRTQIASAVASARVYEEERRRAEALAEIDRAKTAFFSNVSHEFRTPLTLMLSPLQELLAQNNLSAADREPLEVAHRNSLRLLKLVNTLLDFSRIEAGRVQASYEPVDLGTYTKELASVFRSAIEHAGMKLIVDCPPLEQPVYVDRDMWEKIVLNLISNAFKFTFEGEIGVRLRQAGENVELSIKDTGVGIPAHELPHMFERFHRVRGAQARTHEGTGIGLALVQELVHLHGGSVQIKSIENKGTTFTIFIPTGTTHLPIDQINAASTLTSTALGTGPYVQEVLSWLPKDQIAVLNEPPPVTDDQWSVVDQKTGTMAPFHSRQARILLVDDNTDMREYIQKLLEKSQYKVETVADGWAALRAVQAHPPDLVLTDVMMPGLDGFGLLKEIRADQRLKTVPVILLSARAGEEARVEGLEAGADDYLIKPFSARELLARVRGHLEIRHIRNEAQAALEQMNRELEKQVWERTAELRALSRRLVEVQEDERRAIARELHDRAAQTLSALNINLVILKTQISDDSKQRIGSRLDDSMKLAAEAIGLIRNVVSDLRPTVLDDFGLQVALKSYIAEFKARYGIQVQFDQTETVISGLEPGVAMTILRIVQEALTNVARHAQATQVQVSLHLEEDVIHLMVQDNGVGIANGLGTSRLEGHGLRIMRERAAAFSGSVGVEPAPAGGTRVEANIPIPSSKTVPE